MMRCTKQRGKINWRAVWKEIREKTRWAAPSPEFKADLARIVRKHTR